MDGNFWVFGYGSLIWRPDFAFEEAQPARLHGWHRSMCLYSTHYRGTPEVPGLVLGLDRGGSCRGLAFRIAHDQAQAVRQALHDREMVTNAYAPCLLPLRLADGRHVRGYSFPIRRDHPQYAGRLPLEQAVALIRQGVGGSGTSRDYLAATVTHLELLGLPDPSLRRLLRAVDGN
jgi:cation transport protein ChaC